MNFEFECNFFFIATQKKKEKRKRKDVIFSSSQPSKQNIALIFSETDKEIGELETVNIFYPTKCKIVSQII